MIIIIIGLGQENKTWNSQKNFNCDLFVVGIARLFLSSHLLHLPEFVPAASLIVAEQSPKYLRKLERSYWPYAC